MDARKGKSKTAKAPQSRADEGIFRRQKDSGSRTSKRRFQAIRATSAPPPTHGRQPDPHRDQRGYEATLNSRR